MELDGDYETPRGAFYVCDSVSGAGRGAIAGSWTSTGGQYTFGSRGDKTRVYGFTLEGGKIFGRDVMGHIKLFPTHDLTETQYYEVLEGIKKVKGGEFIMNYFKKCFKAVSSQI